MIANTKKNTPFDIISQMQQYNQPTDIKNMRCILPIALVRPYLRKHKLSQGLFLNSTILDLPLHFNSGFISYFLGLIFLMLNHSLKYFCLQCGSELLIKHLSINGDSSFPNSQICLKCGYTLLFGTIRKKLVERNE